MAPRGKRGGARANAGGHRQGTPGKAYANRTDLMNDYAPTQGLQTPAIGGLNPNPMPATGPPPPTGVPQAAVSQVGTAPGPPGPLVTPDQVTPMDAPTDRPYEPVTAGMAGGPGVGPEALAFPPVAMQWMNTRDALTQMASAPTASPMLQVMAQRFRAGF